MTWLGKILAFLVLLASVAAAAFTAQAYVTRTNWKTRAETYKKAYDLAAARVQEERKDRLSETTAADTRSRLATDEAAVQSRQINELATSSVETASYLSALAGAARGRDEVVRTAQAVRDSQRANAEQFRRDKEILEKQGDEAKFALAAADKARRSAESAADDVRGKFQAQERAIRDAQTTIERLKQEVASNAANARAPTKSVDAFNPTTQRAAVALQPGTKSVVGAYRNGRVTIGIGLDAGVQPGSVLHVRRKGGDQRYLGDVVVDVDIEAKRAVATFKPVSGRPVQSLTEADLPQAGDIVLVDDK